MDTLRTASRTLRAFAGRAVDTATRARKALWPPPTPRTAWQMLARGAGVSLKPAVGVLSLMDALVPKAAFLPAL